MISLPFGYERYQRQELVEMLASGQTWTVQDMAGRWRELHRSLTERAEALKGGLDRLDEVWEGEAAEMYLAKMRELENTIRAGAEAARSNWNALEDAADSLVRAQTDLPRTGTPSTGGKDDPGTVSSPPPHDPFKQAVIDRLHDLDSGYYDARDRLTTASYAGPPPADVPDGPGPEDGPDGGTELAGSSPGATQGPSTVGTLGTVGTGGGTAGGGAGAVVTGRPGAGGAPGGGPAPAGAAGAGRGAVPMGTAGAGGRGGQERKRNTWLQEIDDEVWGDVEPAAPRVLGKDPDERRR